VRRGALSDLAEWAADGLRGEITIVVGGASANDLRRARGLETPQDWVRAVDERVTAGVSRKEAIAAVAEEAGRPRREVYDAVLRAKV
jgi:16S rRNA (cytidine1402-2'-O)-methyltransferase